MQKPLTCLLIDDDLDDHEIFLLALEEMNYSQKINCSTATDGIDALKKLSTIPQELLPDCIFLDLNMPKMNGKQCLAEIKKITHLKDIPVAIYSTSAAKKDVEETQRLGAAAFLVKPPSIPELSELVKKFLTNIQLT